MEPILFIEKFFDWPDESGKLIRVQQKKGSGASVRDASFNFQKCNVKEMISSFDEVEDMPLELEGFDVSRGNEVDDAKVIFGNAHYTLNMFRL
jgi:hypothetical protein